MSLDDLDLIECGFPLFPNEFPIDPPVLSHPFADITMLNKQLEWSQLDTHALYLRIEVERAKHQRLSTTLKNVKREIIPQCRIMAQLQQESTFVQSQLNAMRYYYESEIARITSTTSRGLSRMHAS